jgi:serine protease Do
MKRKVETFASRPLAVAVAAALLAAVACGAIAGRKEDSARGPFEPLKYDPTKSLAALVDEVSPAVVNIRATAKARISPSPMAPDGLFEWFFGPRGPGMVPFPRPRQREIERRALGSGFIIDEEGLVVTNRHVVGQADEIEVQLADDRTFEAELIGSDERTDVALLRLADAKDLPTVSWGDSDELKVGDHVVAIGNPFGLDHTVTSGIVSAKERVIGAGPYDQFIQTDASINPGNSGGPLFDLSGAVIGINTAIAPHGQGIGFAIPANLAKTIIDSLVSQGRVVRGWLGISFQPLTDDLAGAFGIDGKEGVVVASVESGSPADKGGIETGDVIVSIAGRDLDNPRHLPSIVAGLKPGQDVEVEVIRDGKRKELTVEIGEMPGELAGRTSTGELRSKLGFEVEELTDEHRKKLDAEDVSGVVVTDVSPESPASGVLRAGDIIVEVNRDRVRDVDEFARATKDIGSGDNLLLRVYRRGAWVYLILKL